MEIRRTISSLLLVLGFVTTSAGAQHIVDSLSDAEASALKIALAEVAHEGARIEVSDIGAPVANSSTEAW